METRGGGNQSRTRRFSSLFSASRMSMDGSDPATWDPALDGVLAAPENHTVLYEDDLIRVISVRVAPGATGKPHHHRFPSVFVIDRMAKLRDFNGVPTRKSRYRSPRTSFSRLSSNSHRSRCTTSRTLIRNRSTRLGSSSSMASRYKAVRNKTSSQLTLVDVRQWHQTLCEGEPRGAGSIRR